MPHQKKAERKISLLTVSQDLEKLEKSTKQNIEELRKSTKDDIDGLARMVKNTIASKEELMGVKSELGIRMGGVEQRMERVEGRLERVEERLEQTATKKDVEQLVTREDKIIAMLEKRDVEEAATTQNIRRVDNTLWNHETRIKKLEKKEKRTAISAQ